MSRHVSRKRFLVGALGAGGGMGLLGMALRKRSARTQASVNDASFHYDLEAYMETDPALDLYRESPTWLKLEMQEPTCLAVDSEGTVYVGGDNRIDLFASTGRRIDRWPFSRSPTSIHVDSRGRAIVALRQSFQIREVRGDVLVPVAGEGPDCYYTCAAVSGESLFLADAGERCVRVFDMQGQASHTITAGQRGDASGRFVIPSPFFDIAVAADGLLIVAHTGRHQLETYTVDGRFVSAWGEAGMGIEGFVGCCNPADFVRLNDGRFVTSEKGLNRIKIHKADGSFAGVVAGPRRLIADTDLAAKACRNCSVGYSLDIAADRHNNIYALDPAARTVRLFTPLV